MLLAPGPIPTLSAAGYDAPPESFGLAAFVTAQLQPLDDLETGMDGFLDPTVGDPGDLPDDGTGDLLDYSDAIFTQTVNTLGTVPVDAIDAAAAQVDEETINAFAITPAEAFEAVPPPQVAAPPDEGTPPAVPYQPSDASISNTSRPNSGDFAVGDGYTITVHISPNVGGSGTYAGVAVQANKFVDQESQPGLTLGTTDANGFLAYSGVFGPGDEGAWHLVLYGTAPDGTQINLTTLDFNVGQLPATPALQVTFFVQELGYDCEECVLHVGYHWTLTVNGPPNQTVAISGTFNGAAYPTNNVGSTDATGAFTLSGQMGPGDVGTWVENYSVGGVDWGRSLNLTVLA